MANFSSDEICKIVDKLVGEVEATGESHEDARRLENLKNLIDLTDSCLDKIHLASFSSTRYEASMRKIGRYALQYLADSAEWFEAKKKLWDSSNNRFERLD